jgi:two-component system, NtrC family, nitrogen regulation response regulator NtrX
MTSVLIADDDADIRESFQLLLEDAGYATLTAADGEQALTILHAARQPLIAIVDISLPRLDGLSILWMAVHEGIAGPPRAYILCTGHVPAVYAPFADVLQALHASVLPKPCDMDAFLMTIERAASTFAVNW